MSFYVYYRFSVSAPKKNSTFCQRNSRLAQGWRLDLSNDQSQDERRNQSFVSGGNRSYRPNSSKDGGGNILGGRGEESESSQQRGRTQSQKSHSQNSLDKAPCPAAYVRGLIENLNAHRRRHYTPSKKNLEWIWLGYDLGWNTSSCPSAFKSRKTIKGWSL